MRPASEMGRLCMYKDSIVVQPLRPSTEEKIVAEFEDVFEEARRQAKTVGMTPTDVTDAIAEVRKARRIRRSRR